MTVARGVVEKRYIGIQEVRTISSSILLFLLHTTQYSRYTTSTSWGIFGMEALSIVSVCDVNTFIARDWVPIYDECWMDAVLPLFLHLNRTRSQHRGVRKFA